MRDRSIVAVTRFPDVCVEACSSFRRGRDYRNDDGGNVDADLAWLACVSSRQRGQ